MPDIQMRFNKDMLVLSAPVDATLARQGVDVARDRQYLNLMEPDVMLDAFRLEDMAGAQCLVAPTEDLTQARLAHVRMDGDAEKLAKAAVDIVLQLKPQHVLAEIGPCGLPLDASSKTSLNENRSQYADAARVLDAQPIDALLFSTNAISAKIPSTRLNSGPQVAPSNMPMATAAAGRNIGHTPIILSCVNRMFCIASSTSR